MHSNRYDKDMHSCKLAHLLCFGWATKFISASCVHLNLAGIVVLLAISDILIIAAMEASALS